MAGYIGKSQGVTQVDGYNRSEADAEFVQVTGDTMTGALAVNGDLTVDTNTLFVDAANNRVGIGTSSPAQKLVTYAASNGLEILNTVRNDNVGPGIAAIGFNVSAGSEGDFTQAGIGFQRGVANGGGALVFYNKSDGATGNFTTANERMSLTSAGDVAITQPAGRYTVDTTGGATSLANGATVNFSNASGMLLVNNYNNGHVTIYLAGGGAVTVVSNAGAQVGTFAYNVSVNGYTFTNNSGATATFGFCFIRTRPTA